MYAYLDLCNSHKECFIWEDFSVRSAHYHPNCVSQFPCDVNWVSFEKGIHNPVTVINI